MAPRRRTPRTASAPLTAALAVRRPRAGKAAATATKAKTTARSTTTAPRKRRSALPSTPTCAPFDDHEREVLPVGREREQGRMRAFVRERIQARCGGALYVSGSPGTGKSLCASITLQEIEMQQDKMNTECLYLNCMRDIDPRVSAKRLLSALQTCGSDMNGDLDHLIRRIQKLLPKTRSKSGSKMIVVVLDECDYLAQTAPDYLRKLFAWPNAKNSRLIVVGVANSLDLIERFLPELRSEGFQPKKLLFSPYQKEQLKDIATRRVESSNIQSAVTIDFDPIALEMCARKVSSMSGDARKMLDACRQALDIAQRGDQSPSSVVNAINGQDVERRIVRVGLNHVLQVFRESVESRYADVIQRLPQHQQIALLCALRCSRTSGSTVAMRDVISMYSTVCKRRGLMRASTSEVVHMMQNLDAASLLSVGKSRKNALASSSVRILVQEDDARFALADSAVMLDILDRKMVQ